jgi:5-methylcytosine-specific restriction endonuclease McrA
LNQHRKRSLKRTAVEYMGGCCVLCGYSRCTRALHFHHLNPHEKDYEVSSKTLWYDVQKELEKCVLLCANCHSEVHDGMIDHEILAELAER